jgi:D-alanyl-D-alanine carboxypeptidase
MIETFGIFLALALSLVPVSLAVHPVESSSAPRPSPAPEMHIAVDSGYTARSILLFNFDDDKRIADYNSQSIEPIASLSKIMAGYLVLKNLPVDTPIAISTDAIETEGAIGHFTAKEVFSVKDLLSAAMIASSNDAAMALAERVGENLGGENYNDRIALFVNLMNATAQSLGMTHTTFVNPSGLDIAKNLPSNYSTAQDLARLLTTTREETPLLWDLSREPEKTIFSARGTAHSFSNLNILAARISNFIGSKTGSTDAARESVVELFEAPLGTAHGLIILGADPGGKRFEEAERIISQIASMLP